MIFLLFIESIGCRKDTRMIVDLDIMAKKIFSLPEAASSIYSRYLGTDTDALRSWREVCIPS